MGTITELKADRFSVLLDSGVTVEFTSNKPPRIALAYPMAHEDAGRVQPKRSFILFEGNNPEGEYSGISMAAETSRVRTYVTSEQAEHFTVEGVREMKRRIGAERLARHDEERDRAEAREKEKAETSQKQSKAGAEKAENPTNLFPDPPWKPQPYAMNDWFVEGTDHLFASENNLQKPAAGSGSVATPEKDAEDSAAKLAEEIKRRLEEERRREELRRQEEDLTRNRAESNSQSHSHGHSH